MRIKKVQTIWRGLLQLKNRIYLPLYFIFTAFCLCNCTGLKSLQEGEKMLTGYNIDISGDSVTKKNTIEETVDEVIEPVPNQTLFGTFRPGPAIYQLAGTPKKEKGFKNWLKYSIGSSPVTLSDVDAEKSVLLIKNRLRNIGYFKVKVRSEVKEKKKTANVTYYVEAHKPYRLRNIYFPKGNSILDSQIVASEQATLLDSNQIYDLEKLKDERQRISEYLKNQGYFYFDRDFLLFQADTTVGNNQLDIYLNVKSKTPEKARTAYDLDPVVVFMNRAEMGEKTADTVINNDILFVAHEHLFKHSALSRYIFLEEGKKFKYNNYLQTLNKLIDLNVFRFVNVRFELSDSINNKLRSEIALVSLPKKNLQVSFGPVSRSNNFVGTELQSSFRNRNVFGGAEELSLNLNAGFETQINREQTQKVNTIILGAEVSLEVPRFILPFNIKNYSRRYIPRTSIEVGFDYQERTSFYVLNSLRLTYAYRWKETNTRRHELKLANIEYSRLGNTSTAFDELLANNALLELSFQNQFILSTQYNFFYDNQVKGNKNRFYWNPSVDISGNLVNALQNAFDGQEETDDDGKNNIFGLPYAQYFIASSDLRFYRELSKKLTFASRLITGVGVPYGNSSALPYKKQFFIGGTNSIRAFPARSIGPGTYLPEESENNSLFFDQTGDIKLELNTELRFDIYGFLKGAFFLEAGNVWTVYEDGDRPGSQFDVDDFYKQLAIGTGLGIRVDASFFVLRADWGLPLRNPANETNPWVINNFGSGNWRRDNIILNIGIGYPF